MNPSLMSVTLKEVRENAPFEVAVLPWGSCEPHGLHLPYGCDTITAERFAVIGCSKARDKGARVILLPSIPIGTTSNLFGFPLTLHLAPTTQLAILKDTLRALEAHRIYKLVLFNGHGGNEFKALLRELYGQTKVHVFLMEITSLVSDSIGRVCEDTAGEHANEGETACLLALAPELVHLEWADAGRVRAPRLDAMKKRCLWTVRPWHLLTENSGYGNAAKATAAKGRVIVEEGTDRMAQALVELAAAKVDKWFPYVDTLEGKQSCAKG